MDVELDLDVAIRVHQGLLAATQGPHWAQIDAYLAFRERISFEELLRGDLPEDNLHKGQLQEIRALRAAPKAVLKALKGYEHQRDRKEKPDG